MQDDRTGHALLDSGLRAEADEYPIADVPDIPLWSENYAVMFAAPATGASLLYLVGRWHSDPTVWREVIGITLPDGRILFAKNFGRRESPVDPGTSMSRYEVLEPGRRRRLRFDGPVRQSDRLRLLELGPQDGATARCAVDLTFDAVAPMWYMDTSSAAASVASSFHVEQIGAADGSITFDGTTHRFDNGYAVHDHSRGPRNVARYGWHCWLNGAFPDGRAFYAYTLQQQGPHGVRMLNAAVVQDGRFHTAQLVHIEPVTPDEPADLRYTAVLSTDAGKVRIRVSEILSNCPMSFVSPYDTMIGATPGRSSALCKDQTVRLDWDGTPGFGWSERGFAAVPL